MVVTIIEFFKKKKLLKRKQDLIYKMKVVRESCLDDQDKAEINLGCLKEIRDINLELLIILKVD